MGLYEIKKHLTAIKMVNNLKRYSRKWEKIFDIPQKGLITKLKRICLNLN
jgi:hypothetical protein